MDCLMRASSTPYRRCGGDMERTFARTSEGTGEEGTCKIVGARSGGAHARDCRRPGNAQLLDLPPYAIVTIGTYSSCN